MYSNALSSQTEGVGGNSAPLIAPAGRAWELVFNNSQSTTGKPLDPSTRFSCLYHHSSDQYVNADADASASASVNAANCTLDGAGLGGHPSQGGSYLIAMVMAATMHDQSVQNLAWKPDGVTDADALFLQEVAMKAVRGETSL